MRSDRRTVRPQCIDEDRRGAVLSAGANSVPLVSQSQMTLSWLFVLTRHTVSSRKHLPDVDQPCVSILDSSFAVRMMIAVVRSTAICMFSGLKRTVSNVVEASAPLDIVAFDQLLQPAHHGGARHASYPGELAYRHWLVFYVPEKYE